MGGQGQGWGEVGPGVCGVRGVGPEVGPGVWGQGWCGVRGVGSRDRAAGVWDKGQGLGQGGAIVQTGLPTRP